MSRSPSWPVRVLLPLLLAASPLRAFDPAAAPAEPAAAPPEAATAPAAETAGERATQEQRRERETATLRSAALADDSAAYRIGIGDVIEVTVWKSPELGAVAPVRPDGRLSVPLVGDVPAAGLTTGELKQILATRFREYVTAPAVSVIVKEIHSRKVFVTGEVTNPGAYDLQPRTKLMQALAMAGGLTPYARGRVVVLRDSGDADRRIEVDLRDVIAGRRPGDNLVLEAGDTLVVP
jgi:polysaccharide export outer membrane protein